MQRQQNPDQEHLVFFFERQREAVNDAETHRGVSLRSEVTGCVCVCVCALPAQDLQQLSDPVVMFRLIDEPAGGSRQNLDFIHVARLKQQS